MTSRSNSTHIRERASANGVEVPGDLADRLAAYLDLLAHWNRRINLTALPIDPPSDEAIDRLLIEPVAAAQYAAAADRLVMDIGSGGGSPAIPFKLALPTIRLVMVESKTRKAAFLREAAEGLGLQGVAVEAARFEGVVAGSAFAAACDLVTVRAVRIDEAFLESVAAVVRPGGRLFCFGAGDGPETLGHSFRLDGVKIMTLHEASRLTVLRRV